MASKLTNPLKSILNPYIFILKEGGKIKKDYLDYSLMILFIHSSETLQSPREHILRDKVLNNKKNLNTL